MSQPSNVVRTSSRQVAYRRRIPFPGLVPCLFVFFSFLSCSASPEPTATTLATFASPRRHSTPSSHSRAVRISLSSDPPLIFSPVSHLPPPFRFLKHVFPVHFPHLRSPSSPALCPSPRLRPPLSIHAHLRPSSSPSPVLCFYPALPLNSPSSSFGSRHPRPHLAPHRRARSRPSTGFLPAAARPPFRFLKHVSTICRSSPRRQPSSSLSGLLRLRPALEITLSSRSSSRSRSR